MALHPLIVRLLEWLFGRKGSYNSNGYYVDPLRVGSKLPLKKLDLTPAPVKPPSKAWWLIPIVGFLYWLFKRKHNGNGGQPGPQPNPSKPCRIDPVNRQRIEYGSTPYWFICRTEFNLLRTYADWKGLIAYAAQTKYRALRIWISGEGREGIWGRGQMTPGHVDFENCMKRLGEVLTEMHRVGLVAFIDLANGETFGQYNLYDGALHNTDFNEQAKAYLRAIVSRFADRPNVIWAIRNEPGSNGEWAWVRAAYPFVKSLTQQIVVTGDGNSIEGDGLVYHQMDRPDWYDRCYERALTSVRKNKPVFLNENTLPGYQLPAGDDEFNHARAMLLSGFGGGGYTYHDWPGILSLWEARGRKRPNTGERYVKPISRFFTQVINFQRWLPGDSNWLSGTGLRAVSMRDLAASGFCALLLGGSEAKTVRATLPVGTWQYRWFNPFHQSGDGWYGPAIAVPAGGQLAMPAHGVGIVCLVTRI